MNSTIVVSPRERFSPVIRSLESLFETISDDVRVIVVEGGSPAGILARLKVLQTRRPFDLVSRPYLITPNEARNIGARIAQTDFVVFSDNDIEYQPGWLERLETNAVENVADVVAPLIFIGPNDPPLVHHAGGVLVCCRDKRGLVVDERNRLGNKRFEDVCDRIDEFAPVANEICEFHCLMMRMTFYHRMGGLDERLITRDQVDLALRAKALGATVTFEKDSHVTYQAKIPFREGDIVYHLFRWSDELACKSIAAFEETWGVRLNADYIRYNWIQAHRQQAVTSMYPRLTGLIGRRFAALLLTGPYEIWVRRMTRNARPPTKSHVPIPVADSGFIERLAAET